MQRRIEYARRNDRDNNGGNRSGNGGNRGGSGNGGNRGGSGSGSGGGSGNGGNRSGSNNGGGNNGGGRGGSSGDSSRDNLAISKKTNLHGVSDQKKNSAAHKNTQNMRSAIDARIASGQSVGNEWAKANGYQGQDVYNYAKGREGVTIGEQMEKDYSPTYQAAGDITKPYAAGSYRASAVDGTLGGKELRKSANRLADKKGIDKNLARLKIASKAFNNDIGLSGGVMKQYTKAFDQANDKNSLLGKKNYSTWSNLYDLYNGTSDRRGYYAGQSTLTEGTEGLRGKNAPGQVFARNKDGTGQWREASALWQRSQLGQGNYQLLSDPGKGTPPPAAAIDDGSSSSSVTDNGNETPAAGETNIGSSQYGAGDMVTNNTEGFRAARSSMQIGNQNTLGTSKLKIKYAPYIGMNYG